METIPSKHERISIKFKANYNNKLYARYFQTIRRADFDVKQDVTYDIELNGKGVTMARCIGKEIVLFRELPAFMIMQDTGLNHADSIELFYNLGYNVKNYDLRVCLVMLENLCVKSKT